MMALPSRRDWLFSVKAFIAAMLALYIALMLGLPRPYWAMATVYIVSHPLTGATRSKAVYRACGTLLGASAAVLLVPPFVDEPVLLSLLVALWTGSLLYLSLLDRTPRSYLFMLSAYTMPMIALPAVNNPQIVFDIALARSEEILLGIVCASVVAGLLFPARVSTVLGRQIDLWLKDAAAWAADSLEHGAHERPPVSRHKLAADILAFDQLISHLAYDAANSDTVRAARELRGRMSMLPPILSSLSAMLASLQRQPGGIPAELTRQMGAVAHWLSESFDSEASRLDAERMLHELHAQQEERDWPAMLAGNARRRLHSLIHLWQDCQALRRMIATGKTERDWQPGYRRWEVSGTARHYDYGMILFSTASASLAIFLGCLLWIGSGWADGASAVILGAVACCFFAALDEPAPKVQAFFVWTAVSILLAGVLLFAVLPASHEFETLVAMLALPFLLIGTLIAQPRFNLVAMLLTVNTATFVGIQGAYSADFSSFFNGNIAGVAGVLFALVWTLVTRPFGTELALRRLVHASWNDLALTAAGHHLGDYAQLTARMLDRLALLIPRMAASGHDRLTDGFRELRVGFSALDLQRDEHRLAPHAHQAIDTVLQSTADHFEHCVTAGHYLAPATALERQIDHALLKTLDESGQAAVEARNALVELRVTLFTDSAGFASALAGEPA